MHLTTFDRCVERPSNRIRIVVVAIRLRFDAIRPYDYDWTFIRLWMNLASTSSLKRMWTSLHIGSQRQHANFHCHPCMSHDLNLAISKAWLSGNSGMLAKARKETLVLNTRLRNNWKKVIADVNQRRADSNREFSSLSDTFNFIRLLLCFYAKLRSGAVISVTLWPCCPVCVTCYWCDYCMSCCANKDR